MSLDVDHFHQAGNQNTTHSASAESHSHGSTNCMEKLSSCIHLPENVPATATGQGVAPRQCCRSCPCSAYVAEASSQGCVSSPGGRYCWGLLGGGTREPGRSKRSWAWDCGFMVARCHSQDRRMFYLQERGQGMRIPGRSGREGSLLEAV